MTLLADIILRGATGDRPAAAIEGRLFYDTTLNKLQRDNGSSWDDVAEVSADGWVAAGETWTYASADDPTFTFTIDSMDATAKYSTGMRIKLAQTTVKYFIITKVVFNDPGSTITVYGGTDYDLANAAITAPYYSVVKAPLGFPLDPTKWTVEVTDTSSRTQATPVQNTWYNLGSFTISIPIGAWNVQYKIVPYIYDSTAAAYNLHITLSTANNTESDKKWTYSIYMGDAMKNFFFPAFVENPIVLTAKASYYLNTRTTTASVDGIYNTNDVSTAIIRAICAYL